MRFIYSLVLIGVMAACGINKVSSSEGQLPITSKSKSISKKELLRRKKKIDRLLVYQRSQIWVKLYKQDTLVQVMEGHFPEDVGTIFKVVKDRQGRILQISEVPYMEGDWRIAYRHYFDQQGLTFAYERTVTTFYSNCPNNNFSNEVTWETIVKLYSPTYALMDSTYTFTDVKGRDITQQKCEQEVESGTKVFKNLTKYLVDNNLNFK